MSQLKVATVVGTRPELIRLSRLIPRFDEAVEHTVIHTGQNFSQSLFGDLLKDLQLRPPDIQLEISQKGPGAAIASVMGSVEPIFSRLKLDAVVILGDTNSSFAGIVAERMQIPVYHLEAGNRSFDMNVPEELNRKIVDHASSFNLAYTERARENLVREGIASRRIAVTGSPMPEVISHYSDQIRDSTVLNRLSLSSKGYFLASIHRQENIDSNRKLSLIIASLDAVAEKFGVPIVLSAHPRLSMRLRQFSLELGHRFVSHDPFNFSDYLSLQLNALCVVSDSGTVSEESAYLGFPSVTLRNSMERPEALEAGAVIMTGLSEDGLSDGISEALRSERLSATPNEYFWQGFSTRVFRFLLSTVRVHHEWAGIERL